MSKAVGKYEYAQRLGISPRTLRTWVNVRYFADLAALGYSKNQKLLLPNQVEFLDKKLCVTEFLPA